MTYIRRAFEWNPSPSDGMIPVATTKHSCGPIINQLCHLKNSFSYSGATLGKSLPCNSRVTDSLTEFRRFLHLEISYTPFMERRLSFSKQLGKIYTAVSNLLCKDQFFSMDINPSIAFCRLMNSIRRVERKIEDG